MAEMLEREGEQLKIKRAKMGNKEPEDNDVNINGKAERKDVAMKEVPGWGGPRRRRSPTRRWTRVSTLRKVDRLRPDEPDAKRKKVAVREAFEQMWNDAEVAKLHAEESGDWPYIAGDTYDEKSSELLDPDLVRGAKQEEG